MPQVIVISDANVLIDMEAGGLLRPMFRLAYDHDQCSEQYHERLLIAATKAKCMVFVSGYENDLYNDYLTLANGWHDRRIQTTTRGHNGKDATRQEIVWYNDQYLNAAKSGRVPVHLSAMERKHKKVNPKR